MTQHLPPAIRKLARRARQEGWQAAMTGGGHVRFVHPNAHVPVIASASPSDVNAESNIVRDMRRALGGVRS